MKKIFFILTLLLAKYFYSASPSKGTYSPYSFYGLGERSFLGNVENISMGGIYANTYHPLLLNINNPASLSKLALTNFSAGLSLNQNYFSQQDIESSANSTKINNFGLGIPLIKNKLGMSVGIYPYSQMGYYSNKENKLTETNTRSDISEGYGGLNLIYLGSGYAINEYLSIGVNVNYIFGNIDKTSIYSETIFDFSSFYSNKSFLKGVNFDFSIQGEYSINKNLLINYGAVYKLGNSLSNSTKKESYSINKNNPSSEEFDSYFSKKENNRIYLNDEFSLAIGFGDLEYWNISAQYDFINDNSNKSLLNKSSDNIAYNKGYKISIGGYWALSNNIYDFYLSRITYRAGFFYEKKDFSIHGNNIYDRGISFGMSMPFSRSSYINIGIIRGILGENKNSIIRNDYWKLYLSINFTDRWFIQYKYD